MFRIYLYRYSPFCKPHPNRTYEKRKMIFHPAQSKVTNSRKRFRVVCAGRRGGKTELAVAEMVGKAYAKQNRSIAYVAPTFQQARDIAWVKLKELCKPITKKVNETNLQITVQTQDKGSSLISLRGWESIETMRGQAFDFIVIDEIASMRNWEVNWNTVIRPTLTDRQGEVLFISTPKGFNHFYELYNMENDPKKGADYASFHFTSYDNPYVVKEEIDKARAELPEDEFAQEYLADFRKQQGLVYKEFSREQHLYDSTTTTRRMDMFIGGVDFGFTNPAVVLHIRKDSDMQYWVEDELYQTGLTDARVADYVRDQRFNLVYPDPENPAAIKELEDRNVNIREVRKGKDSVVNGINKVRELLKGNRLHINKRCHNLIMEIESYHYPDAKDGYNDREIPVKDGDHAMDALRYVIMSDDSIVNEDIDFNLYAEKYR